MQKFLSVKPLLLTLLTLSMGSAGWALDALNPSVRGPDAPAVMAGNPLDRIWQVSTGGFSEEDYARSLERLISAYEGHGGKRLEPGDLGRVGLKIYTHSGQGLRTPPALVLAMVEFLESRGFARDGIFLIDLSTGNLRRAGFMPALSVGGDHFEGIRVKALDSQRFFDPDWFYDNPLPSETLRSSSFFERPRNLETLPQDRLSMLPVPLLLDVDFWINLPTLADHPTLGVSGALANATIWNVSNQARFLVSPASASVAVAEIAAIPELNRVWVFSVLSLERYQFMGGPIFNSLYTRSEPTLLLSSNPGALDYYLLDRLNRARTASGFRRINPPPRTFEYVMSLGLGDFMAPLQDLDRGLIPDQSEP